MIEISNKKLGTIQRIYREAVTSTTSGELLQQACTIIAREFSFPLVWIGIIGSRSHQKIVPAAFAGAGTSYLSEFSNCPEHTLIQSKNFTCFPEISEGVLPPECFEAFQKYNFNSCLFLPFYLGKNKAVLFLYAEKENSFPKEEINFFTRITDDLYFYFSSRKNLWNLEELQKKEKIIDQQGKEAEIINSFNKDIVQSLSMDDIISSAVKSVTRVIHPDLILIFLKEDNDLILHKTVLTENISTFSEGYPHKVGACLCGQAVTSREPVFSTKITTDPRCTRKECIRAGAASFAAIPLSIQGRILGVMGIASGTGQDFTQNRVFLETICGQLAVGLQNALLFKGMEENAKKLQKEVATKTLLLKEVHHRVKNNLNVISSLLNLQLQEVEAGKDARSAFQDSRNRIFTMAQVHERLYETENFSEIEMKPYIESVTGELITLYNVGKSISLSTDIESVSLNITTAIPFGLILNEIITNALKYAFKDREGGNIFISLKKKDETAIFTVRDDGIGLPPSIDPKNQDSLGLTLIHLLTDQIGGTLSLSGESGTEIIVQFPLYS